jgi:hypothetical protein
MSINIVTCPLTRLAHHTTLNTTSGIDIRLWDYENAVVCSVGLCSPKMLKTGMPMSLELTTYALTLFPWAWPTPRKHRLAHTPLIRLTRCAALLLTHSSCDHHLVISKQDFDRPIVMLSSSGDFRPSRSPTVASKKVALSALGRNGYEKSR